MRILLDTNIILDLLLDRYPYAEKAAQLFALIENNKYSGYLCANSLTTVNYFLQKALGKARSREIVNDLLNLFSIAEVNKKVLQAAQKSNFNDFEDSVIYEAALASKVDAIITRNTKDFSQSKINVYSPKEFLELTA